MKLFIGLVLCCILPFVSCLTMPGYSDHPCRRPCEDGTKQMICAYNFTLEWYHTMSKACYDCPFNRTHCMEEHCVSADGFFRGVATVNRMMPGPSIQVCHNDIIVVNVLNRFDTGETVTIHWHGIHQSASSTGIHSTEYWTGAGRSTGTQYMDGVGMLTQCPITPAAEFTYRFRASPAGTHYWHAHSGMQRGDGVYGALVVRQPPVTEPHHSSHLYDVDSPDHVIIVNDWMHELTVQKFSSHHHAGDDNKGKGLLINGLGARVNVSHPDGSGAQSLTPRARFTVTAGKRYRFRLISNAILNCPIQISVESHEMQLIASDGQPIVPYPTPTLVIYAGERYDFVLNANQQQGNYWFRAVGLADCSNVHFGAVEAAIIHYTGSPDTDPASPTDYASMLQTGKVVNPFNTPASAEAVYASELRSLPTADPAPDPALRATANLTFYFGMDFTKIDNVHFNHPDLYPLHTLRRGMHLYSPQINNISHSFGASPLLSQPRDTSESSFCSKAVLEGDLSSCPAGYCQCYHRYHVPLHSVVDVVLLDEGYTFDASHPFHLHGYSFRLVGMGKLGSSVNIEEVKRLDREGKLPRNLKNPPSKDTVIVPDGGYSILRFYADNPGEWFFHCHLLFHSEIGMGLVFGVGDTSDLPPEPRYFPRCGSYGPQYSVQTGINGAASGLPSIWTLLMVIAALLGVMTIMYNEVYL